MLSLFDRHIFYLANSSKKKSINRLVKKNVMATNVLNEKQSNEMIADLVKWATGKAPIDIRFEDDDDDQWSVITLYDYNGDKELSLRLHVNDVFNLHLGYYDDEDEFIEIVKPLNDAQKETLPEKLKKVMKKVLDDEKGIRVPGSLLV